MTDLLTFELPDSVGETLADVQLGNEMIRAWQRDGIFQVATTPEPVRTTMAATGSSRRFSRTAERT